ncbi:hypothetical protein BD779DRAFT_1527245 [Infundibulicybe gibba]|nr:hypothetical protein BD779DRAFT_1527245 [Infundibulicybe gibba]
MGVFQEMVGEEITARKCYVLGVRQARTIGMQEGVREAEDALRRLDGGGSDGATAI